MSVFLLVHGAWHSGRSWERVVPLLESAGHRVLAPSLTGYGDKAHLLSPEVGLDTHVDDLVRLIDEADLTGVVLVGHSYAGAVISSAANQVPDRIAHLVYVDSTAPKDGETSVDALPELQGLIDLAAKTESPWLIPPPPEQPPPHGLFGVTDPADVAWLRTVISDHPVRCLQQPARLDNPAAHAISRTHIRCDGGNAEGFTLPPVPAVQPNGSPARVRELPTGHDCMITMPVELSELLLEAAVSP
ncbi:MULTISPECIES: alpha/beta fold hydrolase [unclassified Streptomyces]|uniref:alpha/beta hydrolase n=1 Tax=unclassified Streptomyces TaxID=2593676 RepID=UPI0001C1903D|nr:MULTISPECIES: alpha/beta fold hydrolase [unclassified Streptomyces]AEN13742.1 alpha/beta hydrolase fold protein [Streptomyces sp. SirexAA-E]MYR64573.1 alpha/beta fold hydrolase [Streptomyces sp. SID4939]MYR99219.1 alpha/beta fold hydrolase [Streptomyces sp. SID4940]MYT67630.1 alpha/beta fold hydrolase [Streptomyces sp. SID8357]MYT86474.1 alpha/beta fold hydrolase [Streptomyces sp. SID8360]